MFHCWNTNGAILLMRMLTTYIKGGLMLAFFVSSNAFALTCDYSAGGYETNIRSSATGACYPTKYVVYSGGDVACGDTGEQWQQTSTVCKNVTLNTYVNVYMRNQPEPPPPPPVECTAGEDNGIGFTGTSSSSTACVMNCIFVKTGGSICSTDDGTCFGKFTSTTDTCDGTEAGMVEVNSFAPLTEEFTPQNCGTVNGQTVCIDGSEAGATDNCVIIDGETLCNGVVSYGDCYQMQDGSQICDSPEPSDTTTTDYTPKDPTTGEPLTPDLEITDTDENGNPTDSTQYYGGGTIQANDPYACDNPDTASFELCDGYCDNPHTVVNECVENSNDCVDDPNTLFDETSVCHTADSADCGGYMQPPCDASGNPKTTTGASGEIMTADGSATVAAIEELGDLLEGGWSQPVLSQGDGFDMDGTATESDTKILEYENKLSEIKTELSGMLSLSTTAGTLPCWENYNIPNIGPVTICPREYEAQLSVIGVIVLLLGALSAVYIIFR